MKKLNEPGTCSSQGGNMPPCEDCPLRPLVSKLTELTLGLNEKMDQLTAIASVNLDFAESAGMKLDSRKKQSDGTAR